MCRVFVRGGVHCVVSCGRVPIVMYCMMLGVVCLCWLSVSVGVYVNVCGLLVMYCVVLYGLCVCLLCLVCVCARLRVCF